MGMGLSCDYLAELFKESCDSLFKSDCKSELFFHRGRAGVYLHHLCKYDYIEDIDAFNQKLEYRFQRKLDELNKREEVKKFKSTKIFFPSWEEFSRVGSFSPCIGISLCLKRDTHFPVHIDADVLTHGKCFSGTLETEYKEACKWVEDTMKEIGYVCWEKYSLRLQFAQGGDIGVPVVSAHIISKDGKS